MALRLVVAGPGDASLFEHIAEDVFDGPCPPDRVAAYLADPRLHMVLALDGDLVVGMCSGVHYFHPDKPNEMFINELGVGADWRRRGIATRLVGEICALARSLGCHSAWLVSDPTEEALDFYRASRAETTGENLTMFTFALSD